MNNAALAGSILIPLFAAVGLYLAWYSRHRKEMFERFARSQNLQIRPELTEELQKRLDLCVSNRGDHVARSFDQISSLIDGGSIWIFRAVELLDRNPHGQSYSTHFPRVAASFLIPETYDEWFGLDGSMQLRPAMPGVRHPGFELFERTHRIAISCNARHALSITLAKGYGLVYFEPLVTGGETMEDLNSLYCIAKSMSKELGKVR